MTADSDLPVDVQATLRAHAGAMCALGSPRLDGQYGEGCSTCEGILECLEDAYRLGLSDCRTKQTESI